MGTASGRALAGVVAVAGALALYAGALGHPFLGDDLLAVPGNPTVAQPSAAGLRALWTTDYWRGVDPAGRVTEMSTDRNLYRPITVLSFWSTSWVAGVDAATFRLENVVLHALAAWLVGVLCWQWGAPRGAWVAVVLLAVHPVATDVVNRIVGRADILAVVGVAAFLVVQQTAQRRGWTWPRTLAAWVAAAVALGAKESGLVVVPLGMLQAWLGAARGAGGRSAWPGLAALGLALAPYLVGRALAVDAPTYAASLTWDLGGNPVWGTGVLARLPVACALAWDYATFMVWPAPMIAFDVPAAVPTWADVRAWLGLGVIATLALAALRLARDRHPLALATVWWLAAFAIVSQLPVAIGAYREVRFAYAMAAGAAVAAGWLAERVLTRGPAPRAALLLVVAGWTGWAVHTVVARSADFVSLEALLQADVRQRPASPAALIRLANIEDRAGREAEATRLFERVMALAPASAQARYEFADFHERRGRLGPARALHEEAVRLNSEHYLSLMAIGNMALNQRDLERAATYLGRAAALAPDDPYVAFNLAVLDDARGNRQAALARLTELLARRPSFPLAVRAHAQLRAAEASAGR